MSQFLLERNDCPDSDVRCPVCDCGFDVGWNTEYGDPGVGEHSAPCPKCRATIQFGCYTTYTQEKQVDPKTKLKNAIFENFLQFVEAGRGGDPIHYLVDRMGFTGNFAGLDRYLTKNELIECLEACDTEGRLKP